MADHSRELKILLAFRISRSLAAGIISVSLPYLALNTLHWSALRLGALYTCAGVSTALFGFTFGILADLWGRKPVLILAALMLPLSAWLVHLSHSYEVMLLAGIIGGYSATGSLAGGGVGGAAQPIQSALIADFTVIGNRTRLFSTFSFMSGAAAALGMLSTRLFRGEDAFQIAAIVSSFGVLAVLFMKTSATRGKLRKLSGKRAIGKFSLTGILNGASQGLVTPFLIPFFVWKYSLPKDQMAVYGFASGILGAFSLLLAPRLEKHLGFVKSIAITRGLGAVLLVIFPFVHFLPFALLVYLLTPALRIMALPTQQTALTSRVDPEEYGRALGINQVARLAASSGGTALSGLLFDSAITAGPFLLYGMIMSLNIGLYFRFFGAKENTNAAGATQRS